MLVICSWFEQIACKNEWLAWKFVFCVCMFFPLMPKNKSIPSAFAHSLFFLKRLEQFTSFALFKQATESNSLRLLMTKEQLWAICSDRSWQKRDGSYLLFFMGVLQLRSFAHKKWANPNPGEEATLRHEILELGCHNNFHPIVGPQFNEPSKSHPCFGMELLKIVMLFQK